MCKQKRKTFVEILACEDLEDVEGVQCFTRYNTAQEIVWKFPGALIMLQIHCFVVLYIRLWMWALQVRWPEGTRLDIVAASIFAMLAAYSGSCVPDTALTCWTLNSLSSPFKHGHWHRCSTGVRHNWLCEWAILLFWEGLEYKKFCFKKWK